LIGIAIYKFQDPTAKIFMCPAQTQKILHIVMHSGALHIMIDPTAYQTYAVKFVSERNIKIIGMQKKIVSSTGFA
jgi:hypothetical protein